MTSVPRRYLLLAIRAGLVLSGTIVTVAVLYSFATMPESAEADGFVHGLAYLFGSVIFVLSLGGVGLGILLPSLVGTNDTLGFGRLQRRCLQGAAVLFGGGFAVGLGIGLLTQLRVGLLAWFIAMVFSVAIVGCVLFWRLFEVGVSALVRLIAEETAD